MNATLTELALRSVALAAFGLALRFALVRSSAQARAKVLTLTMFGLVILPLTMISLPRYEVTVAQHVVVSAPEALRTVVAAPSMADNPSTFPWTAVWILAAAALGLRVAISLGRFILLQQSLSPASGSLVERVLSLTRRARGIYVCPEGEPPMTWGYVHPKIALPIDSESWAEPQFRSVVLHEDAHIQRKDWAVTIGFRLVTAMYWFNPLVWLLQMLFERDSERAADDCVLAQGIEAPEYAERLIEVAKTLRPQSGRMPVVAMARVGKLNGRVRAILSSKTSRGPLQGSARILVLSVFVFGAVVAGLALPVVEKTYCLPETASLTAPTLPTNESIKTPVNPEDSSDDIDGDFDYFAASMQDDKPDVTASITSPTSPPPTSKPTKDEPADQKTSVDAKPFDDKEVNLDLSAISKEISDGFKESKDSIDEAQREAERSIKEAEDELDRTEMPDAARKAAKASLKFARDIAKSTIKMGSGFMKAGDLKITNSKGKVELTGPEGQKLTVNTPNNKQQ